MRLSKFPLSTTKETPSDAEVVSHKLMLRTGMIRKLSAGIYTWMPLGLRVAKKVENIVREEMNRAGAHELLMPAVIPAELWQESGRWQKYGPELLRLKDRHDRDFVIGPTHEEVITDLVRRELKSYRQLPVNFYQIQMKFRDERRPRFGVMRGREFLMKDAYSFHMTAEDLAREYANMREAYKRIFQRIGVDFRVVKADSGAIGGNRSEEFHVLANSGEDLLAISDTSDYAANIEAAETKPSGRPRAAASQAMEKVSTPDQRTVEQVAKFLNVQLTSKIKLLVVKGRDVPLIALALRGDHELNEVKAAKHPKIATPFAMGNPEDVQKVFGCEVGYLGPVSCPIPVIADYAATEIADFVCGANEKDFHLRGANWGRDCAEPETADLRKVVEGDPSPDGQGKLKLLRGIEVGHIFQLGAVYTQAMKATVLDEAGKEVTPESGCYGIGVTRSVAAAIEQGNDANGIIWPDAIAPFRAIICPIGADKSAAVKAAADKLYEELIAQGIEVAYDDRGQRPGSMFADADLIGIPHRIVIGDKSLANQQFEYKHRREAAPRMISATTEAVVEILRG
jgi:prolyl-tRNA synthetase